MLGKRNGRGLQSNTKTALWAERATGLASLDARQYDSVNGRILRRFHSHLAHFLHDSDFSTRVTVRMGHQEFDLTRPAAFADALRKHAMHQTASAACRATAAHVRTPTSLAPAPALARTATATLLYSSIAATNPRRARLGPSSRASQQAPPNESSAAPATRATTSAAGASSDVPSKKGTTSAGDTSSIKPIGVSTNAVTISSFLATISNTNNR
jgi:hypothetical protein